MSVESLGSLLAPWADYYGAHAALQSGLLFAHFAGMLAGGGVAFATDRETIRARRASDDEQRRQVVTVNAAHRIVLGGLGVAFVSGLLLLAADFEALIVVPMFWIKMGLLSILLVNGAVTMRAGRRAGAHAEALPRAWTTLQRSAVFSVALWFAVVASGVLMMGAT